jgi:ABC-2 type transport system ATP-binding protein
MSRTPVLVKDVSKRFGTVQALRDASFRVEENSIFGFLGPNGSGKTTTIRLLLGLIAPDSGTTEVLGFPSATQGDQVRERCGALLEHDGLYERMTAIDNLDLVGRIWQMDSSERRHRSEELLGRLGLWERRDDIVRDWSRGMKRKLAVARAIYHRPQLVFLDEPSSGLDPVAAAELVEQIRELAETDGVTVFLTTHILSEAEKLCDRIGVLDHGRLVAWGTVPEVKQTADNAASLEEAFLRLVGKQEDERQEKGGTDVA